MKKKGGGESSSGDLENRRGKGLIWGSGGIINQPQEEKSAKRDHTVKELGWFMEKKCSENRKRKKLEIRSGLARRGDSYFKRVFKKDLDEPSFGVGLRGSRKREGD